MNLKDWFRPIIWNAKHSHFYFGFFLCGIIGIEVPHPWPLLATILIACAREGFQQLSWPWEHEYQTFDQMFVDVCEWGCGGALVAVVDAVLRKII
jgi:hypothetical protein